MILAGLPALAQEIQDCQVLTQAIQGKYSGECKNKKANGFGKSVGTDIYEGNFKNGYPDGEGTYTWQNGDYFKGKFKKGFKTGFGEMHFIKKTNEDSLKTGYWDKDLFMGDCEKPYNITNKGSTIGSVDFTEEPSYPGTITIESSAVNNTAGTHSSGIVSQQAFSLSSYAILRGNFKRSDTQDMTGRNITRFYEVEYPFKIQLNFRTVLEIEICKPTGYTIVVKVIE